MAFFGRILLTQIPLGALVLTIVRRTDLFDDARAPKLIVFSASLLATLFGLYGGGLMGGLLTGIAGVLFAAPCLVPILFCGGAAR